MRKTYCYLAVTLMMMALILSIHHNARADYVPFPVSSNQLKQRIERAVIANNGTCSITSQSGTWITAISHGATGQCNLTFATGFFSVAPACVETVNGVSGVVLARNESTPTTTTVNVKTFNSSILAADGGFEIICMSTR